jgi:hypothetical protein
VEVAAVMDLLDLDGKRWEMGRGDGEDTYGVTRESRILISRSSRRSRMWMEIHWESRGSEGSIVMVIDSDSKV